MTTVYLFDFMLKSILGHVRCWRLMPIQVLAGQICFWSYRGDVRVQHEWEFDVKILDFTTLSNNNALWLLKFWPTNVLICFCLPNLCRNPPSKAFLK